MSVEASLISDSRTGLESRRQGSGLDLEVSCAVLTTRLRCGGADCVAQWIRMNETNAAGATDYFNVSSETECLQHCMQDLACVAVDLNHSKRPLRCWPHSDHEHVIHDNLYFQRDTTLFIPVKRCVASLHCKHVLKCVSTPMIYHSSYISVILVQMFFLAYYVCCAYVRLFKAYLSAITVTNIYKSFYL